MWHTKTAIYIDHAATTPIHPAVAEAMQPYLGEVFGNPSSIHSFGRTARTALEGARETIASFIGADASELVFTSGGTEADNLAILGVAQANQKRGKHIITTQVEHQAVLAACEHLEPFGFEVTYLPVDETGMVSLETVKQALRPDTILVSIMYGNNEVGTIQPIEQLGAFLREKGILFHSDCVQALGSLSLDVRKLPVDMLTISAHKINGPKAIGALYIRRNIHSLPRIFGGSQERKRRGGTENVAGIVGFAEAVKQLQARGTDYTAQYQAMREAMLGVWREAGLNAVVNGHPEKFLPHILNVSFLGTDTETMLVNLDLAGIAASSGSACTSGSLELSHVLTAMGLDDARAKSAIRFSFGYGNSVEQVQEAAKSITDIVKRIVK